MLRLLFLLATVFTQQVDCRSNHLGLSRRSFTVDYERGIFVKDGEPFKYIAGIMHYFRVPRQYWSDRMQKVAAAGMDAVQTYVSWNLHEPNPGVYDFEGQQNLESFLKEAEEAGLLVILRVGPYICAEWDYGGFPAWLLRDNETMTVRTMDKKYIAAVDRWLSVLLPRVKPFLYSNGGPIVMVQVENEYGSYSQSCTEKGNQYKVYLRDTFYRYLGRDVVLFTSDGGSPGCGAIEGVLPTVNFAPNPNASKAFAELKKILPNGPWVDSECYTAWFDAWGNQHRTATSKELLDGVKANYEYGASTSLYMFVGGTNFGYMNGASEGPPYVTTSYDYDAPITEAGDITEKYLAIRNFTSTFKKLPKLPEDIPKFGYGPVVMERVGSVVDLLKVIGSSPLRSRFPLNMEQANHFYGFVLYRHVLKKNYVSLEFKMAAIRDRGYVLFDGIPRSVPDLCSLSCSFKSSGKSGQIVDIIVENQGRNDYSDAVNRNRKGLVSNVTFGEDVLTDWEMYPLNFTKVFDHIQRYKNLWWKASTKFAKVKQLENEPTVYKGEFVLDLKKPSDTFLYMCGWFKGQAFINGFNLGRYWPKKGPQVTLYVPAGILNKAPAKNILVMVELEHSPSVGTSTKVDSIRFVKNPILAGSCNSTVVAQFGDYRQVVGSLNSPIYL